MVPNLHPLHGSTPAQHGLFDAADSKGLHRVGLNHDPRPHRREAGRALEDPALSTAPPEQGGEGETPDASAGDEDGRAQG